MASFLFRRKADGKRKLGDFEVGETIGEGTSSKVKLGRDLKSGKLVALKIMSPDDFNSRSARQEQQILRHFGLVHNRHPNVAGLVSVLHNVMLESKHGAFSSYETRLVSVVITDYLQGGDLFSYIAGRPFNEDTSRAVFQQLVRGVSHLHKHGVVHLDIKPENILIGENGIVKITDFGLSEIVKPLRSKRRPARNIVAANLPQTRQGRAGTLPGRLPMGIRAVASLNSLHSAVSGSSADSFSSTASPLHNFFPSKHHATPLGAQLQQLSRRASISNLSTHHDSQTSAFDEEVEGSHPPKNTEDTLADTDSELFNAITTGHTREAIASAQEATEDTARRLTITNGIGMGIRHSASMNGLSAFSSRGIGDKTMSSTSISSLDSYSSRCSKESTRSTSRYRAPRLVVNSRSGTLQYQAPEVSFGNYDGAKADVYSLGIVLHVMIYGVLPFDGDEEGWWSDEDEGAMTMDADDDGENINQPKRRWAPPRLIKLEVPVDDAVVDLLQGMLDLDPKTRFSLKDVMRHPWVDASRVRGSVQVVADLVKRRKPYMLAIRNQQKYRRKALKRGSLPPETAAEAGLVF